MVRPARLRRRGVSVRAGAIREARLAAGLTLAAIASNQVSRQAVHQVETGKVRPSLPLLSLIAQRTGRPLEYFLEDPALAERPGAEELERLFLARDLDAVVALGAKLLDGGPGAEEAAAAHLWIGAAEVGLGHPDAALRHLAAAAELCAALGDRWMGVEAADWTACALHLKAAPGALARAEQALHDCRALSPVPRAIEARILGHIGAVCVAHQQWREAQAAYETALEVSSTLRDLREVAMMHHNLSIAYQRLGQNARARASAHRALALYSMQSDAEARLRMQNDLGDLLLRQGQVAEAERQLSAALAGFEALGTERRGRNFALLGLAEVALLQERWADAELLLAQAAEGAALTGEPVVAASAHQLGGRLAAATGDRHTADAEYEAAIAGFADLELPERVADVHFEYGEVLERQGRYSDAVFHLKLAAGRRSAEAAKLPAAAESTA